MKIIDDLYFSAYKFYNNRTYDLSNRAPNQASFSLAICTMLLLFSFYVTFYCLFIMLSFEQGKLILYSIFKDNTKFLTSALLFGFIFSIKKFLDKKYVESEYYVDLEIKHKNDDEALKKKLALFGIGYFCSPFVIIILDFILLLMIR